MNWLFGVSVVMLVGALAQIRLLVCSANRCESSETTLVILNITLLTLLCRWTSLPILRDSLLACGLKLGLIGWTGLAGVVVLKPPLAL